jgi:hypothetical protein
MSTSAVSPQRQGILSLPSLSPSGRSIVVPVPFAQTPRFLACGSETTRFTVLQCPSQPKSPTPFSEIFYLVNWINNPIDARITTDGLMLGINQNDLEVLISGILVDPVGVKDAKIGAATTDSFFGRGAEGALVFELVDSLVRWFA